MSEAGAHFELVSALDLFKKAQHDFDKLNKLVNSYDLFNFLCTINHIEDWVEHDAKLKEQGVLPLGNRIDGSPLNTIRLLCNRAKHFEEKNSHPDTKVKKGYGMGRYGVGLYGVGEPSYYVEHNGNDINVLELCKEALQLWEQHFLKCGLL